MPLLEASDRKCLEVTYSFRKMEQKLSSISSDDRTQEQPILTRKYVQGVTKLISRFSSYRSMGGRQPVVPGSGRPKLCALFFLFRISKIMQTSVLVLNSGKYLL
jgi:hypothetical protein